MRKNEYKRLLVHFTLLLLSFFGFCNPDQYDNNCAQHDDGGVSCLAKAHGPSQRIQWGMKPRTLDFNGIQMMTRPGSMVGSDGGAGKISPWFKVVKTLSRWLAETRVSPRNTVVLLPQVVHLPWARHAWADQIGGWLPQFETPQTLARAWAPASKVEVGMITFDVAMDRLVAKALLAQVMSFGQGDQLAMEYALGALVQTAHDIARAAALVPPEQRPAYWQHCREEIKWAGSAAQREQTIVRVALEWAALQPPPLSDILFTPPVRVEAWGLVQAGGPDPLAQAVWSHASKQAHCGMVNLDSEVQNDDGNWVLTGFSSTLKIGACTDFEDEAQRSAAIILHHVQRNEVPVAVVAQDRVLMRRVQALLKRQQVSVQDETGWKLSTSTAAACLMAWLTWFSPQSSMDDLLDALKTRPQTLDQADQLEAELRKGAWRSIADVPPDALSVASRVLWDEALQARAEFSVNAVQSLHDWVLVLERVLKSLGLIDWWASDSAGAQVTSVLHLGSDDTTWQSLSHGAGHLTWTDFVQWVDLSLEHAVLIPCAPLQPKVFVTPLSQAILRPFAAVVFPGADAHQWGVSVHPHPCLSPSQAQLFGLSSVEVQNNSLRSALGHLLRMPQVTMLYRVSDGQDPRSPSPFLEHLALVWARSFPDADLQIQWPQILHGKTLETMLVKPGNPSAPELLPLSLSASACDALRSCPYQFFALRMLGLKTTHEWGKIPDKRDYGTWLHDVLHRFHRARTVPSTLPEEAAHLRAMAIDSQQAMGLTDAEFWPYWVSFEHLVDPYLKWLHERDQQGVRWVAGELELTANPVSWKGVTMFGKIDRIDQSSSAEGREVIELIDYKTRARQTLSKQMANPTEDTQLAFYAALMMQQHTSSELVSGYLPLDNKESKLNMLYLREVNEAAHLLLEGIGSELQRLREGAGLRPLGRGRVCDYCDARGLCRKDHWATEASAQEQGLR